MTNKHTAKRPLFAAIISLVLCLAMFAGTTFAWFTDSITNTKNKILAGNLDIEMEYFDAEKKDWAKFDSNADIIPNTLWEPGHTEVVYLKITNPGTLALKYQLGVNIFEEVTSKNVDNETLKLSNYIYFDAIETSAENFYQDRAAALKAATEPTLISAGYTYPGEMAGAKDGTIATQYVALVIYMPDSIGNKANYKTGEVAPSITLGVELYATQLENEKDSFDNKYDHDAEYVANVRTEEDLINALALGGKILLENGLVLSKTVAIPAGSNATLNLNGNVITTAYQEGSTTNHAYAFENRGTLVIQDTVGGAAINSRGIYNYGALTLESGEINSIDGNGGYAVRNYAGATFTMNGGKVATTNEDDHLVDKGGYDATTLRNDNGATMTINAGIINNICDFTFAIDNYGNLTVNGGKITSVHSTISNYGTAVINGGSIACNGLEGVTAHALIVWPGSETTINGGAFDGKDNYNGFNVDAVQGAKVTINAGQFLACHSGSLYGDGEIVVKGGTFFDDVTSKLTADYTVITADGKYVVVPVALQDYTPVFDGDGLGKALAKGEKVFIANDISTTDGAAIHTQTSQNELTLEGNGATIASSASSVDAFQWEGGTIPAMSTIFSSTNGSNIVVNDLNFTGTMSAIMLGHYQSATYNNYNTTLNRVNVIDTKVVSFSAGVSPAVCVYGTATLNDCNIYGTTLSELDTDPMWPVYDLVAVNYTDVTINRGKIGSLYAWNQAKVTLNDADVDTIVVRGNMNTTKYGIYIDADSVVGAIDLSAITDKAKINITIENGATVGKIVANGVEYASIAEWQNP